MPHLRKAPSKKHPNFEDLLNFEIQWDPKTFLKLSTLKSQISKNVKNTVIEQSKANKETSGAIIKFFKNIFYYKSGNIKDVNTELDFILKFSIESYVTPKNNKPAGRKWGRIRVKKNYGPDLTPGHLDLGDKKKAFLTSYTWRTALPEAANKSSSSKNPNEKDEAQKSEEKDRTRLDSNPQIPCATCQGEGTTPCEFCTSTGQVDQYYQEEIYDFQTTQGEGYEEGIDMACQEASGPYSGQVACEYCFGSGDRECIDCEDKIGDKDGVNWERRGRAVSRATRFYVKTDVSMTAIKLSDSELVAAGALHSGDEVMEEEELKGWGVIREV